MTRRPDQGTGTSASPPEGWGTSSKGGAPYEWRGDRPAEMEDFARLRRWNPDAQGDIGTFVGTLDKRWTSQYWAENRDKASYYRDCPGGAHTIHYEYQHVGGEYNGVTFAKEEIWHVNAAGERVKGIPGNAGEHHSEMMADYHIENFVGPEPNSKAEEVLGTGTYAWDAELWLYTIKR